MASTSSSVGLVRGHTCCPARVASCWRGRTCPYRLRGACWFGHDDLEGFPLCRDVAATSLDGLAGRVRRFERIVEQIGAVPVPQIGEPIGEVVQLSPQERVQNCTPEQIVGVPVPQLMEAVVEVFPPTPQECVQGRLQEQIMDLPVPQIMEAVAGVVRVSHRSACRIVLGSSSLMCQCSTSWSKLRGRSSSLEKSSLCFIIVMTRLAQWTLLGFNIKGLDKCTMPRSGDVMVPALHVEEPVPQIAEEIVERTLPSVHEAVTRFFEQHAVEDELISWETLDASLPPEFVRKLRRRAQELTAFEEEEEEEEEEEAEEEVEILASS